MTAPALSPAKAVLLAAHFTALADIESLSHLTAQYAAVLRKDLVLRILLTFLPETLEPSVYVGFLRNLAEDALLNRSSGLVDTAPVDDLSDHQALKRLQKLHLLQLSCSDFPIDTQGHPLGDFLVHRVFRIDREAGPVSRIPDFLSPLLDYVPALRPWYISTVLPYVRRNFEYYTTIEPLHPLEDFHNLPAQAAVSHLLSQTGTSEQDVRLIGRDLRGLIGPWLRDPSRWRTSISSEDVASRHGAEGIFCPGWEQVLEWLVSQPCDASPISLTAIEQWDGPCDSDLGPGNQDILSDEQHSYLQQTYARAAIASVYSISEATEDTLAAAYRVITRQRMLLGLGMDPTLDVIAANLPDLSEIDLSLLKRSQSAVYIRNVLLHEINSMAAPTPEATSLLLAFILSAYLCTRLGLRLTVKRAAELIIWGDQRDQEAEVKRLIHAAVSHMKGDEDQYWTRVRHELLWLRAWTLLDDEPADHARGIFGAVPREFVESQILKTLLSRSRCALAKSIYEDGSHTPLASGKIEEIIYESSLHAFDNATNPNRSRGGLKKCDEIIHAFPRTMGSKHPLVKRVEALLRCTHALSDYRLVLKQGEPFSPVLLRVHSDPISIIEKVLEQNPQSYTRLQEFLDMASNMVHARIGPHHHEKAASSGSSKPKAPASADARDQISTELATAEQRIVAMCIEAALREDDFETAYSFVVSRLDAAASDDDHWSWNAAFRAGQYIRSARSQQPTHLGTASGNLDIRHLEQRIECLSTALRIAPASKLQDILKTFRRCEEQLNSAIQEELAQENAWEGRLAQVPGAFQDPVSGKAFVPRSMAATAAAQRTEDAPMSLFDLSRATARLASRNLTRFAPPLPAMEGIRSSSNATTMSSDASLSEQHEDQAQQQQQQHTRKRDQLREAATETLVSSVGWLIGANPK